MARVSSAYEYLRVCEEIFSVAVDVSVVLQSLSLLTTVGNISSNSVDGITLF